ncbi:MAG: carboxypeptidase regulatory-like domain-containing protein, partial [Acidobacteriota bacterium]
VGHIVVFAQTTGSVAGTVTDANGAAVPNATVIVRSESGQEFTVVTGESGSFRIPAVGSGLYTVTTTSPNFKRSVVEGVKVDVGLPSTVNISLQPGDINETVTVTGGGEVLQTQTATVGTTITGRQILETPIASRDALDLVALLPGTNSVGAPRRSSINGLPKGALSITIDGVDVQDNLLRSSDGFFTYVRPRVDAIEEVTVSTANPGSEASGDGAVQIKFVTRRGTNDYTGGVFYQHRDEGLNANYWYNNRDGLQRQKLRLNQYGGHFGGPIPFLRFGDGGGPWFQSGKDRAFFFINYEEFRQPEALSRQRTILTAAAQSGVFTYVAGGQTRTANLLTIAQGAGQVSTIDPTVGAVLARIRQAVGSEGTITQIQNATTLTRELFNFTPQGGQKRTFLALRFDANITKKHSLEFVINRQDFVPSKDFLNSQDERFPGFPSYTQGSKRNAYALALRSTFGQNWVNEARLAWSSGASSFSPGISPDDFAYSRGYLLGIDAAGITTPYSRNSQSGRSSPTTDFTDNITWINGSHTISFGGQFKRIKLTDTATGRIVPTISFGIDATETALQNLFNTTNLPGATTAQLGDARNLYATLIGHVTGYASTAYLTADGTYQVNAEQTRLDRQDTYGLYAQDSWRVRPGLTVNFGLRWQPQGSYVILSDNYARINSFADSYGISGLGNLFRPGTLTGNATPTVVAMTSGEEAYPKDSKNFAPSVGVVWSPDFGSKGFFRGLFGASGKSVFRGGYSVAFVREGTALIGSILGANPGGSLSASRTVTLGNLTTGTNLRDASNPNLTPAPFPTSPAYPIALTTAASANAFDPSLKTGSVQSFSFGYQRELDRNTVVEIRYVGNRGKDLFRQHNINEINTIENGVAAEYKLARQNLLANIAANRCQSGVTSANCQFNFAYFGPGTGTVPLPISLAFFSGTINGNTATLSPGALGQSGTVSVSAAASNPASYSNSLFRNTAFASNLSANAPSVLTFAANLEGGNRRLNGFAAGLPVNFWYVNPATGASGSYVVDNSGRSWYDAGIVEVRRRLSDGLRIQASYTWAKAMSDSFQSNSDNFANFTHREGGRDLAKGTAVFDIRHAIKIDTTYDLPFGKGRQFFGNANGVVNALIGGFSVLPVVRWQSGSPIQVGHVQLVGMTTKELTEAIKVRKEANAVYWLPQDIIDNSIKAFSINPLSPDGYGLGAPTGRFLAPAGYGDCQERFSGECGFTNLVIYGPSFFKFDVSVIKRISLGERRNIELRATFLDALNQPNFRVGGWNADVVTSGCCGSSFGQLGSGSAYQDVSTTNDPGGRLIDLMFRFNF